MDLPQAIAVLRANLRDITDPELAHAMRICIEKFPQITRELSSTRAQLQRCQTDRARIHAELRRLSKESDS